MKWGFLDDDSGYFYCIIYTYWKLKLKQSKLLLIVRTEERFTPIRVGHTK